MDVHPSLKQQRIQNSFMADGPCLKSSVNNIIIFSFYVLKFCANFDNTLFCLGRHKYTGWHKHLCLVVMSASDWMAAVRSGWLMTYRDMFRHVQKSSVTE